MNRPLVDFGVYVIDAAARTEGGTRVNLLRRIWFWFRWIEWVFAERDYPEPTP